MFRTLVIIFILYSLSPAQNENTFENRVLKEGEVLVYSINYSVIKLGELKFKVLSKDTIDGRASYRTIVWIKSEDWIPFVDIHEVYESRYDQGNYSNYFRATQYQYNKSRFTEYDFNYDESKILVKKGYLNPYEVLVDSTCDLNHRLQDGLSLFYFARLFNIQKDSVTTSVFENEKIREVEINYEKKSRPVELSAIDYPIDCFYVYGRIGFKSIFGLTGRYSGWFTNDKHAVPVKAKLQVRIGSITAELKKWRKYKWKPPKYTK